MPLGRCVPTARQHDASCRRSNRSSARRAVCHDAHLRLLFCRYVCSETMLVPEFHEFLDFFILKSVSQYSVSAAAARADCFGIHADQGGESVSGSAVTSAIVSPSRPQSRIGAGHTNIDKNLSSRCAPGQPGGGFLRRMGRAQVFGGRVLGVFRAVAEEAEHLLHGARLKPPKTSGRPASQCTCQGMHIQVTLVT